MTDTPKTCGTCGSDDPHAIGERCFWLRVENKDADPFHDPHFNPMCVKCGGPRETPWCGVPCTSDFHREASDTEAEPTPAPEGPDHEK